MIRLICPVCANPQDASEEKQFVFCKYCGTRMNVAEMAAASAAETLPESMPAAESPAAKPAAPGEMAAVPETIGGAVPASEMPAEGSFAPAADFTAAAAGFTAEESPKPKKKGKGWLVAVILAVLLLGGGAAAYFMLLKPSNDYKAAEELMAAGEYEEAIEAYEALGDYKDAPAKIDACLLQKALSELKNGKYSRAVSTVKKISDKELDLSAFRKEAEAAVAAAVGTAAPADAMKTATDLEAYIGNLEEAVKDRFTALIGSEDNGSADAARELLDTFADKLSDTAFVSETVSQRFTALIEKGSDSEAAGLLRTFGDQLSDKSLITETLGKKIGTLLEANDYDRASALLHSYSELNINAGEAVLKAFRDQLETGDFGKVAAILGEFSDQITDKTVYMEAGREKMEALLAEAKDDNVLDLYFTLDDLDEDAADAALSEIVTAAMEKSVEDMDTERIDSLLDHFDSYVAPLTKPAEDKLAEMIEADQLDEALTFIEKLDPQYFLHGLEDQKYDIACALMEKGKLVQASQIFSSLNDGLHPDSREMVQECIYRILQNTVVSIKNGKVYGPDDMATFYNLAHDLDGYKDANNYYNASFKLWILFLLTDAENSKAHAAKFNETVNLTDEQKAELLNDLILTGTPDLVRYEDGKRILAPKDMMEALLSVMTVQYGDSEDDGAQAMIHYLAYLCDPEQEPLPSLEEIQILWAIRPDIQSFCADGSPLFLFLTGNWITGSGDEDDPPVEMSRDESGHFHLSYDFEVGDLAGSMSAKNMGISIMNGDEEVGRLCDITIVGFNAIELYNATDQTTYSLTRMEE